MFVAPQHDLIAAHVLAASRLHGDDTTVPVLAKGKTDTARAWVYMRDDAPFAGPVRIPVYLTAGSDFI